MNVEIAAVHQAVPGSSFLLPTTGAFTYPQMYLARDLRGLHISVVQQR